MVVETCISVVAVGEFRQVLDPLMRHFQNGNTDGYIVGSSQILSLVIFEIFFLNVSEQLSVECSEVAGDEGVASVFVVLHGGGGKWSRVADSSTGG